MKKKKLSILLVMCLIVGILTGLEGVLEVQAKSWSGYTEISSPEDLADIANDLEGKYYLTRNIDMAPYGIWTPIDNFSGILDGNGHVVKNLAGRGGLFERVSGGTVCNLYLSGVEISASSGPVGGICNVADGATIENCAVSGSIYGQEGSGGIIGCVESDSEEKTVAVRKCINMAAISSNSLWSSVGGIIGRNKQSVSVENCINNGKIIGDNYVGGIIGGIYYFTGKDRFLSVSNCYNSGQVEGNFCIGGICGGLDNEEAAIGCEIKFSLNTGKVICDNNRTFYRDSEAGGGAIIGLIRGDFYIYNCVYLSDEKSEINAGINWYSKGNVSGLSAKSIIKSGLKKEKYYKGWDFEKNWSIKEGINNGEIMLNSATVTSYYSLDKVKASVKSGTYKKAQTIELTAAEGAKIYYTVDGSKPTTKSTLYKEPIQVSKTTKIRAIAVLKGYKNSTAVTFTYNIK